MLKKSDVLLLGFTISWPVHCSKTDRFTYFPAFFWRCGAKKWCLISVYHSFLPLITFLFFLRSSGSCFLHVLFIGLNHMHLWNCGDKIYQTKLPRSSVLHVFPLLYIFMHFTFCKYTHTCLFSQKKLAESMYSYSHNLIWMLCPARSLLPNWNALLKHFNFAC